MNEIASGIYLMRLPLAGSSLRFVNTYLIKGNDGYLLVDAGWNLEDAFESLNRQVEEIGASLKDISRIVVTHVHADHYGMAGRVKEISHADIVLHRIENEIIQKRYVSLEQTFGELAEWLRNNGVPEEELAVLRTAITYRSGIVIIVPPDVALDGGETISWGGLNLRVLWTPGHSMGHICLYEPDKKIMFSGDYVLPSITPHISLNAYQAGTNPLDDYLRSLEQTRNLEVRLVLPGHEQPFYDLPGRIDQIRRHHDLRSSEILKSLAGGGKTAYQIATRITWNSDRGGSSWQSLPPIDRRLAVLETLSHLEYLRQGGKVDTSARDGTTYHQAI